MNDHKTVVSENLWWIEIGLVIQQGLKIKVIARTHFEIKIFSDRRKFLFHSIYQLLIFLIGKYHLGFAIIEIKGHLLR